MSGPNRIVLVGGGLASIAAIEALRNEGYEGLITLISDEPELPYDRPPLSKTYLSAEVNLQQILLHDQAWYDAMKVELALGVAVERIDPATCQIRLQDGKAFQYDRLLIGTGARPRALPETVIEPGVGVHYIRTRVDADQLRAAVKPGARAVLIGGGVIGMESAATLVQLGCQVTVLEGSDRIMARFFPPVLSELLARLHAHKGVDVRTAVVIEKVSQEGTQAVVRLAGGEVLTADILVIGIGVTPNVEIAVQAGIELEQHGIRVDSRGETCAPGIFASGDVATFPLPDGSMIRWENWTHARLHAAHAARHMLDKGSEYNEQPWVWSDQYDLNIQVLGSSVSEDAPILRGGLDQGKLTALHLSDGILVGATMINDGKSKASVRKLLGRTISGELHAQLADATLDLKKIVASL
ncbi:MULTISPECIES: NAD(P)/FAD-dependent oxidoreductase [Pseudomonas]|uniref:NAD(P)/FAD-dependent oxidoreductase n=1 Tax=Pseudomonas TaxID=286 RepID=UPI000721C146|nr:MULTISPECIES: FAD-dependent oxidoreductase [Pseudomonas]ALQ02625.1 Ferredoxin reductase [Pseudomonas brassicacearum]